MNAGIANAMNLSWKLAGVIKGWADPAILDIYESERQPRHGAGVRLRNEHVAFTGIARQ